MCGEGFVEIFKEGGNREAIRQECTRRERRKERKKETKTEGDLLSTLIKGIVPVGLCLPKSGMEFEKIKLQNIILVI